MENSIMEGGMDTEDEILACPQCNAQLPSSNRNDDTSFILQKAPRIGDRVGDGDMKVFSVARDFCGASCRYEWLKAHGQELYLFRAKDAEMWFRNGLHCAECKKHPYHTKKGRGYILQDFSVQYYYADGGFWSPIDEGAAFCDREGMGCILRFFEKLRDEERDSEQA